MYDGTEDLIENAEESTEEAAEESTEEATEAESTDDAEAEATEIPAPADGDNKITVGATPVPHAEILDNIVKDVLEKNGWELETVVFNDYVLPNTSLEEGELDANYFPEQGNSFFGLRSSVYRGFFVQCIICYP